MSNNSPIGVFDSGLGGLTVLGELQRAFPLENFIYLGDMARTPYGPKGKETIVRYSLECANFLIKEQVKLLIVACNTSTSHALESLQSFVKCPVIGTIEGAVRTALANTKNGRIGIIGTEATVGSRVYEQRIKQLSPETKTYSLACP
ncbi:MAG: glutamate racemase, partial [Proteobacteria bacterium]|nr:glutamate racemase [Pseudomonadota bacterium]